MTACPAAVENSLLFPPVSTFLMVTCAWGMAAPDGSVTSTFSVASCCAERLSVSGKAKRTNASTPPKIFFMVPQNLSDAIIRDTWSIAHPAGILIPLRKVMDFEGKRREEQYYENTTDTSE